MGSALVLTGNYAVATLGSDRTALAAQITALEAAVNANEGAIGARDILRAPLKERMRQFNQAVRAFLVGTQYVGMLPKIPSFTAAPGIWMKAMADMNNVWTLVNAIFPVPVGAPIPLLLVGGYTLATFTTDQAALNVAFTAIETTEGNVKAALETRDGLWNPIYGRLRQYRLAVQGRFASGAPLLLSLPALTPPAGHTPDAVNASGLYDAVEEEGVVSHTSSADPDLESYICRGSSGGTKYNADTAGVLGTHLAGDVSPFRFTTGLVAPGSKVFCKVFVKLNTGNEKGSKTVTITRP